MGGSAVARKHGRRSKGGGKQKRFSGAALATLAGCAAVLIALLVMRVTASVTFVRYADVWLPDLPRAFDGVTALFISDLNISGAHDEAACERLMGKLAALCPDMLLLGGDYSTGNIVDLLNGSQGKAQAYAAAFARSLVNFQAPLGKFAVLGEEDDASALAEAFSYAGVRLLRHDGAYLEREGETLALVGLDDVSGANAGCEALARNFSGDECVLVLAHNPAACTDIRVSEGKGGGAWADLVLSGHTLGGQISIFNRTLRSFSEEEARHTAGWYDTDDLPVLVSQGLGCRDVKLRLGTRSEVWFLTLRRPVWREGEVASLVVST